MRPWAWRILGAVLYCIGMAMIAQAWTPMTHDDAPAFARKVPRPPECPDCGIGADGAKLVKAE